MQSEVDSLLKAVANYQCNNCENLDFDKYGFYCMVHGKVPFECKVCDSVEYVKGAIKIYVEEGDN